MTGLCSGEAFQDAFTERSRSVPTPHYCDTVEPALKLLQAFFSALCLSCFQIMKHSSCSPEPGMRVAHSRSVWVLSAKSL